MPSDAERAYAVIAQTDRLRRGMQSVLAEYGLPAAAPGTVRSLTYT